MQSGNAAHIIDRLLRLLCLYPALRKNFRDPFICQETILIAFHLNSLPRCLLCDLPNGFCMTLRRPPPKSRPSFPGGLVFYRYNLNIFVTIFDPTCLMTAAAVSDRMPTVRTPEARFTPTRRTRLALNNHHQKGLLTDASEKPDAQLQRSLLPYQVPYQDVRTAIGN